MSPEAMLERAEFATDWMLSKVGASDTQKEEIRAIVARTVNAMVPVRDQHFANRKAMLEALAAPAVDAVRLADLRAAELKLAEQASRALLEGVTDAAKVLTPEQRQQLAQMAERHRHPPRHEGSGFRRWHGEDGLPPRTS
jgi:Spy/CpxP family protein refolding chaperone